MQPVIEANPTLEEYIATDISQAAIDILEVSLRSYTIFASRIQRSTPNMLQRNKPEVVRCCQWDATLPIPSTLTLGAMDCVLMVFALSAVQPDMHARVMGSAFELLRPGGLLCFRDYGLYDMTMVRHNRQ